MIVSYHNSLPTDTFSFPAEYQANKKSPKSMQIRGFLELMSRFELPTSSLPMKCSTY